MAFNSSAWFPKCLYHVCDRRGRVVYVGVTSTNLRIRMSAHRCEARRFARGYWAREPYPFMRWLIAEMKAGRSPEAKLIRICGDDWREEERDEITRLLRKGVDLLNVQGVA